jgi:hypothetical protein
VEVKDWRVHYFLLEEKLGCLMSVIIVVLRKSEEK